MHSSLLRLVMAFGLFALAAGLALTVEGNLKGGLPLVAASVPMFVIPLWLVLRQLRGGLDAEAMGMVRSPAFADPEVRRTLQKTSRWTIGLSAVPFAASAAILSVIFFGTDDLSPGVRVAMAVFLTFFAAVPALLGYQLVRGGILLGRGYKEAGGGAGCMVMVLAGISLLGIVLALVDRDHMMSTEFLVVGGSLLVVSLVTMTAIATATAAIDEGEKKLQAQFDDPHGQHTYRPQQ
ncbi:MAG TPA: hypothetical protein VGP16_36360 [Asanoa sp.]|nr:hypothetical protein [Asanoa sp.]